MPETGNEILDGPYLKYGPKQKSIQFSLDLTPYNPKTPLSILKVAGSKTKFQIFEGETLKIKLKASSEKDREEWIDSIYTEVKKAGGLVNIQVNSQHNEYSQQMWPFNPKRKATLDMQSSPTLSQINDVLIEHERLLHKKIDLSQEVYERYSQDMLALEAELEKKHKDKFGRMKQSSEEFLTHQKDAMEMIAKVTRSIYQILETIAEREIEKDPVAHIRE